MEPDGLSNITKRTIMIVVIETWCFGSERLAEVICSYLAGDVSEIISRSTSNKQVLPSVVVVIPEPTRITIERIGHTCSLRNIREPPTFRVLFTIIMKKQIGLEES